MARSAPKYDQEEELNEYIPPPPPPFAPPVLSASSPDQMDLQAMSLSTPPGSPDVTPARPSLEAPLSATALSPRRGLQKNRHEDRWKQLERDLVLDEAKKKASRKKNSNKRDDASIKKKSKKKSGGGTADERSIGPDAKKKVTLPEERSVKKKKKKKESSTETDDAPTRPPDELEILLTPSRKKKKKKSTTSSSSSQPFDTSSYSEKKKKSSKKRAKSPKRGGGRTELDDSGNDLEYDMRPEVAKHVQNMLAHTLAKQNMAPRTTIKDETSSSTSTTTSMRNWHAGRSTPNLPTNTTNNAQQKDSFCSLPPPYNENESAVVTKPPEDGMDMLPRPVVREDSLGVSTLDSREDFYN